MHHQKEAMPHSTRTPSGLPWRMVLALSAALTGLSVQGQQPPAAIAANQPASAQAVTQQGGVAVAELAPNAPERYVVKRGDTLWGISGIYLQKPWRWPQLWGMNRQEIANPHLIFPGQTLYLDTQGGYARLRTRSGQGNGEPETLRISPSTRSTSLADSALPTLQPHLIEPFLVEPLVVDEKELRQAPRLIATTENRVLMSTGDRVYARSSTGSSLRTDSGESRQYRVFRNAHPLKHPITSEILGYEAQYLGKAELLRSEGSEMGINQRGEQIEEYIPATLSITSAREEIHPGDRLLPMPERSFISYIPRAPEQEIDARVISIYNSSALANAAQNQVITISAGEHDGLYSGHVLRLLTQGARIQDKTDESRPTVKLPSENNGMAMVFRTFERVSYALILKVQNTVRVGDRLVNPQ